MANLAKAMWTHGHSMQIENQSAIAKMQKAGFYLQVEGKPGSKNWFHFAIPTPVIVNDQRLKLDSAMLLFDTLSSQAVVRDVHVYDGSNRIATFDGVNKTGKAGFSRFRLKNSQHVKWGIGISVGVEFGTDEGSKVMRFESAGCDFIL